MSIALRIVTTLACAASMLAAAPANAAPLPPGPYENSCKDFTVDSKEAPKLVLTALCQNSKGEWVSSSVSYFIHGPENRVESEPIVNCNGRLMSLRDVRRGCR